MQFLNISIIGVPDEFGKVLRSENGLYKVNNYEPTNKNVPYKAKKCSTPKPYQGHTYKHTINHNRQYKEYEPHTYDRVYVMTKLHHDKPKQEKKQKPPVERKKTKISEPPVNIQSEGLLQHILILEPLGFWCIDLILTLLTFCLIYTETRV